MACVRAVRRRSGRSSCANSRPFGRILPGLRILSSCPVAASVFEHAVTHVGKMVALLRPPVPESISSLRLKLPPDAVLKAAVQGERRGRAVALRQAEAMALPTSSSRGSSRRRCRTASRCPSRAKRLTGSS